MKTYLFTFSLALLYAMSLTPLLILWARSRQLMDMPNTRKVHPLPVPRIGGIAIFIASILAVFPVLVLNNVIGEEFRDHSVEIITLLGCACLIFSIGLYDDLKGLRARTKLGLQFVTTLIVCLAGINIQQITIRDLCIIDLGWSGYLITLIWIIGITNAMNLIDGLDGLAGGISAIACGIMAVLSIWQGTVLLAVIMLALLGSLTGFLCFNFYPARIFMGDCGSLFLGFIIATASVLTASKSEALVSLGLPILVLGIPVCDMLFSIIRRFLEHRSIMSPDRSHFHHRLLDLGLKQHHVAMIAYLMTLLFSGLGLFMLATRGTESILVLLCCITLLLIVFRIVGYVRLGEIIAALQRRYAINREKRLEIEVFENLELQIKHARSPNTWWQAVSSVAHQLGFVWISLQTVDEAGTIRTLVWRSNGPKIPAREIVSIAIPLNISQPNVTAEFKIAVARNGSLESATRRISLFGRLIDNYQALIIRLNNRTSLRAALKTSDLTAKSETLSSCEELYTKSSK